MNNVTGVSFFNGAVQGVLQTVGGNSGFSIGSLGVKTVVTLGALLVAGAAWKNRANILPQNQVKPPVDREQRTTSLDIDGGLRSAGSKPSAANFNEWIQKEMGPPFFMHRFYTYLNPTPKEGVAAWVTEFEENLGKALSSGISIDDQDPRTGNTVLHTILMYFPTDLEYSDSGRKLIDCILSKTPNLCLPNSLGETPLHLAVKRRGFQKLSIIFPLITERNVNMQNKDQQTPLHLAAARNFFDLLRLEIDSIFEEEREAASNPSLITEQNVDIPDRFGRTPIHWLFQIGENKRYCFQPELLTQKNVNMKDEDHRTPLEYALIAFKHFIDHQKDHDKGTRSIEQLLEAFEAMHKLITEVSPSERALVEEIINMELQFRDKELQEKFNIVLENYRELLSNG